MLVPVQRCALLQRFSGTGRQRIRGKEPGKLRENTGKKMDDGEKVPARWPLAASAGARNGGFRQPRAASRRQRLTPAAPRQSKTRQQMGSGGLGNVECCRF